MKIRLLESLRAVFYTPFYAALANRAYEREGLEVELYRPPTPDEAATSLFDGRADVTWGGPMRMMQHLAKPGTAALVGFAEAVTREAEASLLISESKFDRQVRQEVAAAEARVSQIKEKLSFSKKRYERSQTLAPIGGVAPDVARDAEDRRAHGVWIGRRADRPERPAPCLPP